MCRHTVSNLSMLVQYKGPLCHLASSPTPLAPAHLHFCSCKLKLGFGRSGTGASAQAFELILVLFSARFPCQGGGNFEKFKNGSKRVAGVGCCPLEPGGDD